MGTITPTWTLPTAALITPTIVPKSLGAANVGFLRSTLDLSDKVGASLVCCIGRTHTTAITGNIYVIVRRMFLNKTLSMPSKAIEYVSLTTACSVVAVQNTTVASGVTVIPMTATPTGLLKDTIVCFTGDTQPSVLTQGVTVQAEWCRVASPFNATASSGGTALFLDAPTKYARLASEVVTNQAEIIGPIWLQGGGQYEVIFDYIAATAGEPYIVAAYYHTYNCDTTA
jgi:hypothetical protein